MTIVTSEQSLALIRSAKLPEITAEITTESRGVRDVDDEPPLELGSVEAQALVVGSGLFVAAEKVPQQIREDIVNCTLFAQLAASGEVGDDPTKITQWYDVYFRTLTALGWAQSDRRFEEYKFSSVNAEAHKAIMKVIAALMGPQAAALAIVSTALEALQSMNENSPWITLFDRKSKVGKSARFQVAVAQVDPGGLLQVALCAFNLKAKSKLTQVLFFKYASSSTSMKYAAGKATIYEAALKDQREAIAQRLADYRKAYVGQVKFPP